MESALIISPLNNLPSSSESLVLPVPVAPKITTNGVRQGAAILDCWTRSALVSTFTRVYHLTPVNPAITNKRSYPGRFEPKSIRTLYWSIRTLILVDSYSSPGRFVPWPWSIRTLLIPLGVWQHTFVSPSAFSRRPVVSYWRKYVHEVLVNRLGGLSLPRKSVVRLTDRPNMTLDVYRGRKTTMQQQQQYSIRFLYRKL